MHARVFGRSSLTRDTVVASFVEGARVRADALVGLADAIRASRWAPKSGSCSPNTRRR